jgi:hypothetical protein
LINFGSFYDFMANFGKDGQFTNLLQYNSIL